MSGISERILIDGKDVLQLLRILGILYGLIILILSNLIYQKQIILNGKKEPVKTTGFTGSKIFKKLGIESTIIRLSGKSFQIYLKMITKLNS